MTEILEFFGFSTNGKKRVWGIVAIISMAVNVLDILNIFDGIGFTKRTLNKYLPSIFKADVYRKPVKTTNP